MAANPAARLMRILLSGERIRRRFRPSISAGTGRADGAADPQCAEPARSRRGRLGPEPDRMAALAVPETLPRPNHGRARRSGYEPGATRPNGAPLAEQRPLPVADGRDRHL